MSAPDGRLLDVVAGALPDAATAVVLTGAAATAHALRERGRAAVAADLHEAPPAAADAVVLVADELSAAGEHAEGLLAAAAAALRPGGVLAAAARNRVHGAAVGADPAGTRAWSAAELVRTVGHPGLAIELVAAPGAAAQLRGGPGEAGDTELDRSPGLLDAAPRTLVLARRPADEGGRSAAFFASVPRKLVAAAVVCRDDTGRLLCVHDSFKQHWTIPGGVVDADEDPKSAAAREAWEESGVPVEVGALLGVFAMPWPDRLLLVYDAVPEGSATTPAPVHAHEIGAAAWLGLEEALVRLNPRTAAQVRRCLQHPGETWADPA